MKKTIISLIALSLIGIGGAMAGKTVPYKSSLYVNGILDDGWTISNQNSRAQKWMNDNESSNAQFEVAGVTGGAKKPYDSSYAANAWLISPGISLTAGSEYTVGIWLRTDPRSNSEKENFKITVANESSIDAVKSGTVLLNKNQYVNKEDFEFFSVTYTPTESGDAYFGLNCYSDADQYTMFATGFTVTGGDGGGGTPDDPVVVVGKTIPFAYDFEDGTVFQSEWKSVAGENAVVTSLWSHSSYGKYASFDSANGKTEDNWLISPPLAFDTAGDYVISYKMWINGDLEVAVGTDPDDLSTFQTLNSYSDTEFPGEDDYLKSTYSVTVPGNYYVGFHACSESGDFMGHRLYDFKVKLDVAVPGIVTDLKAVADPQDELKVSLSWTYPSVSDSGEAITELSKAEIYRNDELLHTLNNPEVGAAGSYLDNNIPEAGVYTYKVICHNANGFDQDHAAIAVASGYVGCPRADFPFDVNVNVMDKATAFKFTCVDANEDGFGWEYNDSGYYSTFKSEVPSADVEMDDYLITPYFTLEPGYYNVVFDAGRRGLSYEMGYVTNRHNPADSFVKLGEVEIDPSYSSTDKSYTIYIEEAGDYCFAVHHVGGYSVQYYRDLQLNGFSLSAGQCIPMLVTDLNVADASGLNDVKANITWINPSEDTAGKELTALSYAVVYRDNVEVGRVQNPVPGEESSYTDTIDKPGEYTYKVEVYNANGKHDADAPEFLLFVGPGRSLPYTVTDFSEWTLFNPTSEYYKWSLDTDNTLKFSESWYSENINAYALAPVFQIDNNSKYEVTIVTDPTEADFEFHLVAGPGKDPADLKRVNTFTATGTETTHVFTINALDVVQPEYNAIVARDTEIHIGSGKNYIGLHALNDGELSVKSFAVKRTGVVTAVESIEDSSLEIETIGNIISLNMPADISVYSLDGRLIASGVAVSGLELPVRNSIVVVVVKVNGSTVTRKINIR